MTETKRYRMSESFTPDSTGRCLYAGSTYDLPPDVAEEVEAADAGKPSKSKGEPSAPESAAGTPINTGPAQKADDK